jgi:hypothetical protein
MVFTLLLSTTPTSLFGNNGDDDASNQHKLMALTEQLLAQTTTDSMNHWTLYLIARAALRFGHWRLMALPLLENIQKSVIKKIIIDRNSLPFFSVKIWRPNHGYPP